LRKQELSLEMEEADHAMHLDRKLIAGVVRELIDNAMTYSPPGARVAVRVRRRMGHMQVDVEDTGCGIPPSDLAHIFTKFTRGANATKFKPIGNGLGLYIAKGIVERAGGRMTVHSQEGKGTRVSFTLPV
jgi:signal transduction histidine kinase